ncbi:tail fiber protein [Aeromonas phage Asp37]|nr:tail fiber protein [Aeromonas phage Asp37]
MNKAQEAAPLLRPLITTEGLKAAVQASTLGMAVKIVKVGITATPGEATADDTSLPGAQLLDVADGRLVNSHQVNVSTLLPDTFPSMGIAGIAFYLEDGTMFAVYREPEPFLEHTGGTTLLVGMDLVMDNIPSDSVIVESTEANLILGDWVPVERTVNGKALTKDITLSASDVGAVNPNGDRMTGKLEWIDVNRYINAAGSDLHVAAKAGKVIIDGKTGPVARVDGQEFDVIHTGNLPKTDLSGYVPTTRKVNEKPLSADITLTAEDVKAVPAAGGRMTGKLTLYGQSSHIDFVETDQEPEKVWRAEAQGGNFSVVEAGVSTRLTLKAGGGANISGSLEVTGNVSATPAPTAGNHLTNKTYVDSVKDAIDTSLKNYLPLAGGTMKGAILAAIMKGAMLLKDKASIAFQDGGATVFHAFANSNALRIAHGNNGENKLLDIGGATIESAVPLYANAGLVTRSSDGLKWLSMEVPATGNPYIAARAAGESAPTQAMSFGKDAVDFFKQPRANTVTVKFDAGLKFSPNDDLSGTTWALGVNATSRTLGLNKYVNAAWSATPFWIGEDNITSMVGLKVQGGADVQYMQVRNAGNPSVELHDPGRTAVMMYKPQGTSTVRFCSSNGAGGEALGYGGVDADGFFTVNGRHRATYPAANRSWSSLGQNAFHLESLSVLDGQFIGVTGANLKSAGKWTLEFGTGAYVGGAADLCAHVLNCTDGASYHKFWRFRNDGELISPSGGGIHVGGIPYGSSFGVYGDMVTWAQAAFAANNHSHTAAQGNASMVQGRHSEVGTYMFAALHVNASGPYNPGQQVPGNLLYPAACAEWAQNRGWTFSGTWMCCGYVSNDSDDRWGDRTTLWFRVA